METVKISFLLHFFFFFLVGGAGRDGKRSSCLFFLVDCSGAWLLGYSMVFVHQVLSHHSFLDHLRWNLSLSLCFNICELENSR